MKVKVIRLENGLHLSLPERATSNSAGRDLYAAIPSPITINPLSRLLIPTGIAVELNPGYEIQIRPRSGLSFKYGITVLNSPGTIDPDYRGELGVILVNLGENSFVIEPGMRIAQMLVTKYEIFDWEEQTSIEETIRGKSGFGSSGL